MPLRLNFKRTHRYNVSAKDLYVIRIYTLDGTCVEYTVSSTTTGRDALEYVSQRLDIEDICVFGLKYEDWSGESRWLFLNKSVKKQLDKHARQHALTLGIMLFIDNPQFISDPQLRRLFYLQLKHDVATGILPVTLKLGIKLSAYSLQADFGDFVDVETTMSSWREKAALCETNFCGAFDLSATEYVDDILWGYLHLQGVSQDNAIWYFLDEIRHIPRYGIRTFRGTTSRNEPAELGVSRNGVTITTLETQQRTVANLKWEHIKDLTYSRKTFTIQMLKKNKSVHFMFEDLENARYLWQFCIQMHSCYIEYWTRIKSLPQQPAIHISEPPDILRGTELRHPSPESPMPNEVFQDSLQFSPVSRPSPRSPLQLVRAPHKEMCHGPVCQTPIGSQPRSFKIDPSSIISSAKLPNDEQRARSAFVTDSKPNESVQNLALLTAVHEGVAESESSTLVGQWSLRSAADTLDSQMLNQGCVTCLPGREWLHPAGWFQPRVHSQNNLLNMNAKNANSTMTKHGRNQDNVKQTKVTKRARPHHHNHHRRHQEEQSDDKQPRLLTAPEHANPSARKQSQTGLSCSQNAYLKPRAASTGQVHDNIVLHLSHADRALMENRPSSPTSMGSSDSSSEHEIVASRASFSSSSSSCCSESAKKAIVRQCNSGDHSCSSTSSSTSSIHSSLTEQHCADVGVKKSAFAFTAALCTATHNIAASKPSVKLSNSNQTNIVRVTNRKMWLSNAGALRPLLSGLNQRHYRPQVQMKRQQAAVDAVLHEQQHLDETGGQAPFANMTTRTEPSSKETNRKLNGNKPLHEFQRWLLEAKQRFPVTWANTMINGRRMTLQISVPMADPNNEKGVGLKSHHCGSRMMDTTDASPLAANVATPDGTISDSDRLTAVSTVQPGRLARSSSEACAHQLAGANPLQFVNQRTNGLVNTHPTPFAVYLNEDATSDRQIRRQRNQAGSVAQLGRLENTPAIHLYPPSPTRTPHNEESPPAVSELNNPDLIWIPTVLEQSKHNEAVNITEQYSGKEACQENAEKLLTPSSDEVGSRRSAYNDHQIVNSNGLSTNSVNRDTPLQRQGAFRGKPSSARLIPYPLNLNDANRLAVTPPRHMPDGFTERTVGGIVRHPGPVNELFDSSQQHLNSPHNLAPQDGKVIGFMYTLHKGTETHSSGHFSAPPSTPSGKLHFVWGDTNSPTALTPVIPQSSSVHPHDVLSNWHRSFAVPNDGTSLNMSHLLATPSNLPAPDVTLPSENSAVNLSPETNPNGTEVDLNEKPMTTSLTNSSMSSDQSSSNRPPSNGPLHLLTHSDIHQLLSLTNIRETELAHRLLVEYRQVLLQQQSLHTNSVSTPNLTASQELQMCSSSTAAEDIEDVEVEATEIAQVKKEKERYLKTKPKDGSMKHDRRHSQLHFEQQQPHQNGHTHDNKLCQRKHRHTLLERKQSSLRSTSRKKVSKDRSESRTIDSPDYVNAEAFRGDQRGYGERPMSLVSSTDMESNGTFRILSSIDTRTSSGAGCSLVNLDGAGESFCSNDGAGTSADHAAPPASHQQECYTNGLAMNPAWEEKTSKQERNSLCNPAGDYTKRHETVAEIYGNQPPVTHAEIPTTAATASLPSPPDICKTQPRSTERPTSSPIVPPDSMNTIFRINPKKRPAAGEYENIENLATEQLKLIQCAYTTQSMDGVGDTVASGQNRNSTSNLAYSTMSNPGSPSSCMQSSSTLSSSSPSTSSFSSCSSSSASDSSSDLGQSIPAHLSHSLDRSMQQAMHSRFKQSAVRKLSHCSPILLPRQKVRGIRHTVSDRSVYSFYPYRDDDVNRTMYITSNERCFCADGNNRCEDVNRLPSSSWSRNKTRQCTGVCHQTATPRTLIKSSSLRINSPKNGSPLASHAGPPECALSKRKALSFDPFSDTALVRTKTTANRRNTPVRFEQPDSLVANCRTFQTCRKAKRPHMYLPNVCSLKPKSCLKKSSVISELDACEFRSEDDDATENVRCLSDFEHDCLEDNTSATLSPTGSPRLSAASSYSYSTSSLDAQTEELCPRLSQYHARCGYWCMRALDPSAAHCLERMKRGGSLDPTFSKPRSPNTRSKRISQPPPPYRNCHHKGYSERKTHGSPTSVFHRKHSYQNDRCDVFEHCSTALRPHHGRHLHFCPLDYKGPTECTGERNRITKFTRQYYGRRKHDKSDPSHPSVNSRANASRHTDQCCHRQHHHHHSQQAPNKGEPQQASSKPPVVRRKSNELSELFNSTVVGDTTSTSRPDTIEMCASNATVKPPRPKDLSFLPRDARIIQNRNSPKLKTTPNLKNVESPQRYCANSVTIEPRQFYQDISTSFGLIHTANGNGESSRISPMSSHGTYTSVSLIQSPDLIPHSAMQRQPSDQSNIYTAVRLPDSSGSKSKMVQPQTLTTIQNKPAQSDPIRSHSSTPSRMRFLHASSSCTTPSSEDAQIRTDGMKCGSNTRTTTLTSPSRQSGHADVAHNHLQLPNNPTTLSPSSPTAVYVASFVLTPSHAFPSVSEKIRAIEKAKYQSDQGNCSVLKTNTLGHEASDSDKRSLPLTRSGSLEPNDLLVRQSRVASSEKNVWNTLNHTLSGLAGDRDNQGQDKQIGGVLRKKAPNRIGISHSPAISPSVTQTFSPHSQKSKTHTTARPLLAGPRFSNSPPEVT
ncbi:hypothetical protein EG68_06637 [Paragonimus skrjabini miyazakii]|uniref:protein-tyrosine-phosphatase n=1 Tax=Paragonimus skrjabini miyazakii TaxID=59628 RepID=A0A8S9YNM1_9TREM|nr:hypothetical protein EG68_06637 [Paragonimus skrjabini miyazakii]